MNPIFKILRSASLLLVIIATVAEGSLSAQINIVGYDSTNPNGSLGAPSPDLAAAESASNVNPILLSRGAGLIPNQGVTFNSRDWSTNTILNSSSTDYVQWGWAAGSGLYNLVDMTIQYDRSATGPSQLAILASINGGALQTVYTDSNVNIGDESAIIPLAQFQNVASAQFRLFGFDASSTGGTLDIERFNANPSPSRAIVVRGVTAVPEPTAVLALLVFSAGGCLRRCRRRIR
jgi:hypothetical protein